MADKTQLASGSRSRRKPVSLGNGETVGIESPKHILENAKEMGNQVIGAVQESATSLLDEQRKRAAEQIGTIADMVRNSVEPLDRQSAGAIRRYAEDTARQIDDFAETLRTRSWGELAGDVEDFARRWPVVFIASAIATGFVAGRFLVSSASRQREAPMAQTPRPMSGTTNQPSGGARYDYGAAGGPVSGSANSGDGSGGKETP